MMAVLSAVGAVLLFLLKVIGILLGVLVALGLLFLLVPISVDVVYEHQEYVVHLVLFGIPIKLYPVPNWLKRLLGLDQEDTDETKQPIPEPQQEKAAPVKEQAPSIEAKQDERPHTKTVAPEKPKEAVPAPPQPKEEPATQPGSKSSPSKRKIDFQQILSILETARGAIGIVMKGIWLSLWIRFPIRGQDAADTAVSFGKWNARIGGICALLSNLMQFRLRKLDLIPDFQGEYEGQERIRVKLTASIFVFCIAAIWTLIQLKQKKIL